MYIIKRNLQYFDKLRLKVHTDSQIKIAYHWRKYKKAKDKRKAIEMVLEEERLAKIAKKKSKTGASNKSKVGVKSTATNSKFAIKAKSSMPSSS
jgi:hypothetical protein